MTVFRAQIRNHTDQENQKTRLHLQTVHFFHKIPISFVRFLICKESSLEFQTDIDDLEEGIFGTCRDRSSGSRGKEALWGLSFLRQIYMHQQNRFLLLLRTILPFS